MAMGFTIQPDGWNKVIDVTASSRILSSLGRRQIRGGGAGDNVSFQVGLDRPYTGGILLPVPTKAVWVDSISSGQGKTRMNVLRGVGVSGGNALINARQDVSWDSGGQYAYDISFFEIPAAQPQTYGIYMQDATDFCTISDVNRFGYVTYRDTININGAWTIPTSVPNRESCVIFARWNNTDTPLFFDRDSLQIQTFTGFGSSDGSVQGGTVNGVQIVIVSTGVTPPVPQSRYGTIIVNASNQITFSSAWPPVIWRGSTYSFPYYVENDTGWGAKIQWNGSSGNVSQPMVPLGSFGFQCGDWSASGTYPYKVALRSGLLMSGNSVSTYRAKNGVGTVYYYTYPCRAQAGLTIPCIDAADYF